ncbi:hypothetical protein [Halotia branconii]
MTFLETKSTTWPATIMQHQGVVESIIFESYRNELLPPNEIEL